MVVMVVMVIVAVMVMTIMVKTMIMRAMIVLVEIPRGFKHHERQQASRHPLWLP